MVAEAKTLNVVAVRGAGTLLRPAAGGQGLRDWDAIIVRVWRDGRV